MQEILSQLNSDKLRDQDKRELWEATIKDHQASGMMQAEYCRRHNLCQHKFSYHLKQYRRRSEQSFNNNLLPVSVASSSTNQINLKLMFPSGYFLEFSPDISSQQLEHIISSLRSAGC